MKLKTGAHAVFTLAVLAVFLTAFLTSRSWPIQARLFPSAICIPAVILCLVQFLMDLWTARGSGDWRDTRLIMDLPVDRGISLAEVTRRAANIWGWIAGFFAATWLLGFIISTPLFIWLYLTFQGREKWWIALSATGTFFVFFMSVFHFILHVPWTPGVISGPQDFILSWIGKGNLF